jgi:hypothetical protein
MSSVNSTYQAFSRLILVLLYITTVVSCKKDFNGTEKPNLPPNTYCIADTIIRTGDDRLSALVTANWWGDDPDGYITHYEYTFDSVAGQPALWNKITRQDSTFLLPIPAGNDTFDFHFFVRAIDNRGAKDPSPARLRFPVRNSAPHVIFLSGINNPLTTFPVVKFFWQASDPDGNENLNYFELCWNDTTQTPYTLNITASSAMFEATSLNTLTPACFVYQNNTTTPLDATINGMILNDTNRLYIRVVDKALAKSKYVSSYPIYIKKPVSDILLVDGYGNNGSTQTNFYAQNLIGIGITQFDTLAIFKNSGGVYQQLAPDNITQARIFKLFKTIIWFSNDATASLSLGQKTLNEFFDNNGKLFFSTYVSSSFDQQSTFLNFTPAQSLTALPQDTQLVLNNNAAINALQSGYPNLSSSSIVSVVRPFNLTLGATALYSAELLAKQVSTGILNPWTGNSIVMAKKNNNNGTPNFIFTTLELNKLNGLMNMNVLFQKIFVNEFGL